MMAIRMLIALPAVVLAGASAQALRAEPLSFGNGTGGSTTLYGQFSPAYVGFDDGTQSYGNLTDNSHSNTRVGLFFDQGYESGTFQFNFETALGAPGSSRFSQDFTPDWTWDKTLLRKLELSYRGNWGRIWAGQGEMATDGASGSNLSLGTIASSRAVPDTAGGYFFRFDDGMLSDVVINKSHRKWDGSRRMRIRYDTPSVQGYSADGGAYLSTSYGIDVLDENNDNTYYDAAARYWDQYGVWAVKASGGIGWIEGADSTSSYWSGSVSALHETSGLNGTLAGGGDPAGGDFIYGNLGLISQWVNVGDTATGIDYYAGRNTIYQGARAAKWGVHAVQYFDDAGLSVYLAYDRYSFDDDTGASYKDASATMAGLQWKF